MPKQIEPNRIFKGKKHRTSDFFHVAHKPNAVFFNGAINKLKKDYDFDINNFVLVHQSFETAHIRYAGGTPYVFRVWEEKSLVEAKEKKRAKRKKKSE